MQLNFWISLVYGFRVVFWSSKKQSTVTLSSMKSEYVVKTHVAKEGIWLRNFIKEVSGKKILLLTIMAYNQGAITLVNRDWQG